MQVVRSNRWNPRYRGRTGIGVVIEAGMIAWEREKETARWMDWFRCFAENAQPAAAVTDTLDLRLMLGRQEARLQWRTQPDAPFADLKQAQAKRFSEHFEHGRIALAPEALPIWSALHKPWHYESWWTLRYDFDNARASLNRVLRLPLPPNRVVNEDGQPLVRVAEPLLVRAA